MLLAGLGIGSLASQLGSVTVSSVPDEQSGEVGGLQNTITNLGISVGTALTGAIVIAALSSSFLTGVEENPAVPASVTGQGRERAVRGRPLPLRRRTEDRTRRSPRAAPGRRTPIVEENETARLDGLRTALSVLAIFALVGLFFTGRIPTEQPAAAPQPASGAGLVLAQASSAATRPESIAASSAAWSCSFWSA